MLHYMYTIYAIILIASVAVQGVAHAPAYDGKYHGPWFPFGKSKTPFARPDGRLFNLAGKTQYFAGANAWWLSRLRHNADVDTVLDELQGSDIKVVRVWGYATFNYTPPVDYGNMYGTWFQLLNETGSYVNYGANGLARLDYLVYAAEQRNMSLVIPLVDYNSGLGGIDLYQNVYGCDIEQWYTDAKCQNAYRSYAQTLVLRYKDSPAIFAWAIMNEPRCEGCPTSVITNFATSISKYIKSLDPKHMVTLDEEGWFGAEDGVGDGNYPYNGGEGGDFLTNLKIPTLDYGTVHCYPTAYGYPLSWGSTWIKQHDQIGAKVGKPIVIEEYGTQTGAHKHTGEAAWQSTILKNTKVAMDMFWDFTTPNLSIGVPYSDTASIFYNDTKWYNPLVRQHAAAMLKKPVK